MPIRIFPLEQRDIPGVVECIQEGFADDPYHLWVFDSTKVSLFLPLSFSTTL